MAESEQEINNNGSDGQENEKLHKCDQRRICSCCEHSVSFLNKFNLEEFYTCNVEYVVRLEFDSILN